MNALKSRVELLVRNNKVFYKTLDKVAIGSLSNEPSQARATSFPVIPTQGGGVYFTPSQEWDKAVWDVLRCEYTKCPTLKAVAMHQKEGFLNINDQRTGVWGRVNDPSDILGVCLLRDGSMVAGTFEGSGTHVTYSHVSEGLLTLTPYLHEKLLEKLNALNS